MNYYTLQIEYGSNQKPEKYMLKDLNPGSMDEMQWIRQTRQLLFTTGFHIESAPGTYHFISPFVIVNAYLLRQDSKYQLD